MIILQVPELFATGINNQTCQTCLNVNLGRTNPTLNPARSMPETSCKLQQAGAWHDIQGLAAKLNSLAACKSCMLVKLHL